MGTTRTGGLAGIYAGETSLCTVGKEGTGLTYRGYDIYDLVDNASFEEVAYLLLRGNPPNNNELDDYIERIKLMTDLPDELKTVLEMIPRNTHPMDVLRTGVSFLGNFEPEDKNFSNQAETADRLLSCMPSILLYWHRFHVDGKRINLVTNEDSISGHFLHLLHDRSPSELHRKTLDTTLILYAEHEFNASTFTGRVITATLSDMHSAITGAIGALRGNLHGGANEAAMEMIENWKTRDEAKTNILDMLANKGKIMGFGHAIYSEKDPRNAVIKEFSKELSQEYGDDTLYQVSEEVEQVMWDEKKLFPNADFFHASAYFYLGIPTKLFTPIFVMSRVTGWTAHCMEQRANNRIIRPSAEYTGPETSVWVDLEDRE